MSDQTITNTIEEAHLDDARIDAVVEALSADQHEEVYALCDDLSAGEVADLYEKISEEERTRFLAHHTELFTIDSMMELDSDLRRMTLESMSPATVSKMIADLDSDDALDLIVNLDPVFQKDVIRQLSGHLKAMVEEGLSFPEDSAGRMMQREFVAIPQFWTVGKTIDYIRAASDTLPENFLDLIIIDPMYHVVGEVSLNRILRASRSEKVMDLLGETSHPISADMDQEDVAHIFRRDDLTSAPVVDSDERLIGVITVDDVVEVIEEEAQEDFLRLGGVDQSDIYRAVLDTTKSRFSWLFVNLLTAIAASIVIGMFDATIEQVVALAILMPIVASMGGNAGTQALTVAVRALATRELSRTNRLRVIWKETLVGFINGVIFAVIIGGVTWAWFENTTLGVVIAAAMVINLLVAGVSGAGVPVLLDKLGVDPAVASTVVLTTLTDVIGFFAFLGLAAAFLI